jgi:hypothetical protein
MCNHFLSKEELAQVLSKIVQQVWPFGLSNA